MPFLAPIAAGIAGAVGAIGAAAAPIVAGVGDAIGTAAGAIGSIAGSVGGGIASAIGGVGSVLGGIGSAVQGISNTGLTGVIGALVSTVTDVISTVKNVIAPVISTVADVISPIKDLADNVSSFARQIQDGLIAPIIQPIEATVSNVENLTKEIHTFTSQGITGILQIPGAIAEAFTNTAAAFDQSFRQLSASQEKIVNESLIPGLNKAIAPGLDGIGKILTSTSAGKDLNIDTLKSISLGNAPNTDELRKIIGDFYSAIENPQHWYETLVGLVFHGAAAFISVLSSLTPAIEDAAAVGRSANPTTKLDVGTATRMLLKGILSSDSWRSEIAFAGYDKARQDALLEDASFLPDPSTAISWWLRRLISDDQLAKVITAAGGNDADVQAFKGAAQSLIQPGTLLDWLARGIIAEQFFVDQCTAQGYTPEQIALLIKGGISTPDVRLAIAAEGNALAAANNWFATTYGSAPSDEVWNSAHAGRVDDDDVRRLWEAHWQAMPIQTAITLFFRGQMNRAEVTTVIAQNNFPPDMVDLFISAQADLIENRTIPTLLTEGAINETEALLKLKERGFSDDDANLLIQAALLKKKAVPKPAVSKAAELSQGAAETAFRDGVIDETQFRADLALHGMDVADIEITVNVAKFTIAKATKTETTATLKAQLALGQIAMADALAALYKAGFTNDEVARFQASVAHAKKQAAKLPSEANIIKMHKAGLIDDTQLMAALDALGYAAPWDQLMFDLITGENNPAFVAGGTATG